jgi:hypothetical protein
MMEKRTKKNSYLIFSIVNCKFYRLKNSTGNYKAKVSIEIYSGKKPSTVGIYHSILFLNVTIHVRIRFF